MLFSHHFMANKQERKTSMHLGKVIQGPSDSLRSYVKRFNLEMLQIPDLSEGVAFDNFVKGSSRFKFDVVKKGIRTLPEIMMEAESYIHATEICSTTKAEKVEKKESARPQDSGSAKRKDDKKKEVWTIGNSSREQKASESKKRARPGL